MLTEAPRTAACSVGSRQCCREQEQDPACGLSLMGDLSLLVAGCCRPQGLPTVKLSSTGSCRKSRPGACLCFALRVMPFLKNHFLLVCRVPSPPGLPPADWAALDAAGQQLLRRLQLASLRQRHIAAELAAVAGAQPGAVAGRSREVADGLMASAHTNNALLGSGESLPSVLYKGTLQRWRMTSAHRDTVLLGSGWSLATHSLPDQGKSG